MHGRHGEEGLKQGWVFVHSTRVLAVRQTMVYLKFDGDVRLARNLIL
jgi:hypothetical protein